MPVAFLLMPTYLTDEAGKYVPERVRSRARLVVLSDSLEPTKLAERLGLAPDESWLRGDRRHGGGQHLHHGFAIESRLPEVRSPEDHLADLVERLGPAALRVSALADDPEVHSARVWVSRHGENWNPGFSLTARLVRSLDALSLGLDIDVYVVSDADSSSDDPDLRPSAPH